MKEKEDNVILYLHMLENDAKKLQEAAHTYQTDNKELSRQLSDLIIKIDKSPLRNPCLILKGFIENRLLTIKEIAVWYYGPDHYNEMVKVDGDLRDQTGTLYISLKNISNIRINCNVFSTFLVKQSIIPKLDNSYVEELDFPYPERIGICKKLTKEDIERAKEILPKYEGCPYVNSVIFELDKDECYFLMMLNRDTHRSGPHYLLQSFSIVHVPYENIIAGRHYYSKIPSNVTFTGSSTYINIFKELGFIFNKPNNKENENRLQEQETVGREGYTGCILYGGKDVPRCAIGHLRNKERVEIKAVGVRMPKANISSRCAKVLRT